MISKYGYDVVAIVMVVTVLVCLFSWYFVDGKIAKYGIIGAFVVLLIFTLGFFRDPERRTPPGENLVIAPADGEIVLIKDVWEGEYLKCDGVQVSIFMSPLNVHVNRYPLNGKVSYYRYFPGKHIVAMEEKSSLHNERTHIGIENGVTRVFFKQIAGFVARRVISKAKVGDIAVAGARFGMIRFGSRVDVIVPKSLELKVKLGDKTVAGETVVAVAT